LEFGRIQPKQQILGLKICKRDNYLVNQWVECNNAQHDKGWQQVEVRLEILLGSRKTLHGNGSCRHGFLANPTDLGQSKQEILFALTIVLLIICGI